MTIEKFIKNGIYYIKEIYDKGTIHIYPDPEFQPPGNPGDQSPPPLPDLTTVNKKLDFIIDTLNLKSHFSQ